MHLKEERTGQQAWPTANFCFFILESILFFSPVYFPKFSSTGTEESPKFICGPGIAKLLPSSGSVGRSVLYSPSPQPITWLCTAMLLLKREDMEDPEEILLLTEKPTTCALVHTNHSTGARQLCRSTERRAPGQPCSPSQRADHSTSPKVLRARRKQENIHQVHHCCSPTTKLPLEHLAVKQWMKTQLKMKGANYASHETLTPSFHPSSGK